MDKEIPMSERRRKKRISLVRAGCIAAGITAAVAASMWLMKASVSRADLNVATADKGPIEITVSGTGNVSAAFEEVITSPINSRVVEVYRQAGDSVKAGDPLLRLDLHTTETEVNKLSDQIAMKRNELDRESAGADSRLNDIALQVEVKEMTLNRLKAELRNEIYLDSIGSGTGDNVRQAELAVSTSMLELRQLRQLLANERRIASAGKNVKNLDIEIARKNLDEMSRTLTRAGVSAPRDAVVTFIFNRIGEQVTEGQKVAVIADPKHFRVDAEIAEAYAGRVNVGSKAIVKIGNEKIPGTVSNVQPEAVNGVITFTVCLEDDTNPRLKSGLKTDVFICSDVIDETVRIPNGPYYSGPGKYSLFFMRRDGKSLMKKEIILGESNFEFVEVKSGVNPGDRPVISDMSAFKDLKSIKLK